MAPSFPPPPVLSLSPTPCQRQHPQAKAAPLKAARTAPLPQALRAASRMANGPLPQALLRAARLLQKSLLRCVFHVFFVISCVPFVVWCIVLQERK